MSRTVCPDCRQHHRTRTPPRNGTLALVALVAALVVWAVLVTLIVGAVFG